MAGEPVGGEKFRASSYNEAQKRIERLGDLQSKANYYQESRNYEQWHSNLLIIYKEIQSKFREKEREDCEKTMATLAKRMGNLMGLRKSAGQNVTPVNTTFVYNELFKFDCHLRRLIDKHGFSAPDSEDASEAAYK